jgi:energy-coupling factor transporter ATP-binding protein EcfA2
MKLDIINYCQNKGLPSEWRLEGGQFGNINLIVGRNASGKSKILKSINLIAGLLFGDTNPKGKRYSKEWTLIFDSSGEIDKKEYILKIEDGKVIQEKFIIGSKPYLDRNQSGEGSIWAEKLGDYLEFQTPIDEIAAVKRRDSIQHPFFEELYTWANSSRYYQFGTDLGKTSVMVTKSQKIDVVKNNTDFRDSDQVIGIFKCGQEDLKQPFIEAITSDMSCIGYNISDIGTKIPSQLTPDDEKDEFFLEGEPQYLYIKESELSEKTEQFDMSQGMFRALSLIIQVNYSLMAKKPSCILIDDIGEGLDFERSSAIIKLLIEKVKNSTVQLVMTTNDRFIMNGVPLEYWSVIERKPGVAKLHNIHNSQQIFEDFKFTGLNNFNFFSTEFYLEGFGEEEEIN